MSLLPFVVMNALILGIIGHVFLGAVADRRAHQARVDNQTRSGDTPI